MNTSPPLHVAVGIVKNAQGQILIAQRHKSAHQGGLWEFPGGKLECNETPEMALVRELQEEIGIVVKKISRLITLYHRYPDLIVHLHVFWVNEFLGEVTCCENQPLRWVTPHLLKDYPFLKANQPIITAIRLPVYYAIVDDTRKLSPQQQLTELLKQNITLIQARLKTSSSLETTQFFDYAVPRCRDQKVILMTNSANQPCAAYQAEGLHLTSHDLLRCSQRPHAYLWVSASCHSLEELQHAEKIGVDFAVLAPVMPTKTHHEAPALGWLQFSKWVAECTLPVYALGGMNLSDLESAIEYGAQGIASIRAFIVSPIEMT
ncbi:MAG: Nudix family hydrolase [Methylovulum sp.]|jgi:8-oxo-dGTP diphosphatase|nr:Nudix family hydrolase [Methylovulum sp.]